MMKRHQALAQAAAAGQGSLKEECGSIVNIASIVGKLGNKGQANYSASKAGVIGLTKTTAQELARYNGRVNVILPGFIETPMTKTVPEKLMAMTLAATPLARMGKPEEIASAVAFLASHDASYMTGAQLEVTGGLGM